MVKLEVHQLGTLHANELKLLDENMNAAIKSIYLKINASKNKLGIFHRESEQVQII